MEQEVALALGTDTLQAHMHARVHVRHGHFGIGYRYNTCTHAHTCTHKHVQMVTLVPDTVALHARTWTYE
jgi:hypothetical protein